MIKRISILCSIALLLSLCLVALVQFTSDRGYSSTLRRKLAAFKNTVPNKTLITDLIQLSDNIYGVNGAAVNANVATKSNAKTGTKWFFHLWVEAEYSTEAMIVSSIDSSTKVVVAFRGSEQEFDDWFTNAKIIRVDSKFVGASSRVGVHRGFQGAVTDVNDLNVRGQPCNPTCKKKSEPRNGVAQRVEQELINLVGPSGEVYITGHSLGGVTAQYMAVWMAAKYPNMRVTMVTIGAPRLGNDDFKAFSENLNNLSMWRVVYNSDTVARIPPNFIGYEHAGHLYQIDEDSKAVIYYRQVGNSKYEGAPTWWYYRQSVSDHSAEDAYLAHCNKYYNRNSMWATGFKQKPPPPAKCPWWKWWC